MNPTLAIAKRELTALFFSPIAYVVMGLFSLGASLLFLMNYSPGYEASLRDTFFWVVWLMIFLIPAISMRLISDEFRTGTIESLMTAPINDAQVIVGKWLGAMGFLLVLMIPLVVLTILLALTARPDYGPIITGLLGLVLVGGLFLAIGTFSSASTQNQIISFLLTVFILCLLTFVTWFLPMAAWMPDNLRPAFYVLNINEEFESFNKGLIDLRNLVYFACGISFFLFLAVLLLQSKRWR